MKGAAPKLLQSQICKPIDIQTDTIEICTKRAVFAASNVTAWESFGSAANLGRGNSCSLMSANGMVRPCSPRKGRSLAHRRPGLYSVVRQAWKYENVRGFPSIPLDE
jgi:hypothetical protein